MEKNESKILMFGGTGYVGSYIAKASIKLGHPTYVFSRPNSNKNEILNELQSMGAIIVKGTLDEHNKLVSLLKEVDVVIFALAYPHVLDQFKIIEAIKAASNIKRFLPSDFGVEDDRVSMTALPPFQAFLEKKKKIRRATEESNIPYSFVSANCFAAYFVNYLLRPYEQKEEITVYSSGEAKATDPRACNRVVIYRPPANVIAQLELISLWEKRTGRTFNKVHVPEEEMVALSETLPDPQNIPISILHSVFVKGATANFDLGENEVEASALYPDLKLTTVDKLLDIFLCNPPKPAYAVFE